jgi:hypothetical protein
MEPFGFEIDMVPSEMDHVPDPEGVAIGHGDEEGVPEPMTRGLCRGILEEFKLASGQTRTSRFLSLTGGSGRDFFFFAEMGDWRFGLGILQIPL